MMNVHNGSDTHFIFTHTLILHIKGETTYSDNVRAISGDCFVLNLIEIINKSFMMKYSLNCKPCQALSCDFCIGLL